MIKSSFYSDIIIEFVNINIFYVFSQIITNSFFKSTSILVKLENNFKFFIKFALNFEMIVFGVSVF